MAVGADSRRVVCRLVLMTGQTGLTRRYRPLVRLVAGLAPRLGVRRLAVQPFVLGVRMTAQAVHDRICLVMRLVAFTAVPHHRRLFREDHGLAWQLLVTAQTGLSRRPERAVLPQEGMALGTVHVAHLLDLDGFFLPGHVVGVAGHANLR